MGFYVGFTILFALLIVITANLCSMFSSPLISTLLVWFLIAPIVMMFFSNVPVFAKIYRKISEYASLEIVMWIFLSGCFLGKGSDLVVPEYRHEMGGVAFLFFGWLYLLLLPFYWMMIGKHFMDKPIGKDE